MQVPEALSKGRAYDSAATESQVRSWTNAQLLHKWEVLPARAEIPIRRVKWVQAMTEHNHAHLQTNGGDLGTASRRGTNIDGRGFFYHQQRIHSLCFCPRTYTCLRGCLARRISSNYGWKSNPRWCPSSMTKTSETPSSAQCNPELKCFCRKKHHSPQIAWYLFH